MTRLETEVDQLRGENWQLQARVFGQKTEHATSRNRSNQTGQGSHSQGSDERFQK
jgi:hypothetical protein